VTLQQDAALVTAIPAAQDALAAGLERRDALAKVKIDVGYPAGGLKLEHIWLSGVIDDWTQEWSTSGDGGPAGIDESFTLHTLVYVQKSGANYTVVRNRVVELIAEVQAQLRSDFTLGGTVQLATITGGGPGWDEGLQERSRSVLVDIPIHCDAYLTAT
jgi:hypothetical protein